MLAFLALLGITVAIAVWAIRFLPVHRPWRGICRAIAIITFLLVLWIWLIPIFDHHPYTPAEQSWHP